MFENVPKMYRMYRKKQGRDFYYITLMYDATRNEFNDKV